MKNKKNFSIPVDSTSYYLFMADQLPSLLEGTGLYKPEFIKQAALTLRQHHLPSVSSVDVVSEDKLNEAAGFLSQFLGNLSGFFNQYRNLSMMAASKPKRIIMNVSRTCPSCPNAPKTKKYRPKADIPVYPCIDCKCEPRCDVWYKAEY